MEQYLPLAAILIDSLLGDPRSSLHPVVMIGNCIAFGERKLLNPQYSHRLKKITGMLLVILVLGITYGVTWWILKLLSQIHPWAEFVGGALLLSLTISPNSLAKAGNEIYHYLVSGDLKQARFKVGWIVGRDTDKLTVPEITRATVETIAENIVDGVISPLFYFIVGGVPLAFLYRAVNTLDSMVGYKNDKYKDFGMCAARVDDLFNYIPARLTALFILLATIVLRFNFIGASKTIWKDAKKHPSPNSGLSEAAVAGALGIRLGGLNFYGGIASQRAYMGEAKVSLIPIHIKQTIHIMYITTAFFVASLFIYSKLMV
ncbi:adenosylcobinamide-phosphate synthase CbiB [Pelosinus propionicus]|uniref:Cobalamin biosynthesis protein CobD n=1 Tax=Pelosinus propionicus DSM 13327 TaxID=1123291 RepID=A0A1I4H8M4_9FIRM|nr:adenosylcobinamide-phosphate synthase CbiB [Pelosinus propionicus]SFL38649.1 adenosylcobinamide-phosphate synthase [Pelosinus propionicus DSM 13327]